MSSDDVDNNRRRFLTAGTAAVGLVAAYQTSKEWSVVFEVPVVEIMLYRTESVPLNWRGVGILGVQYAW